MLDLLNIKPEAFGLDISDLSLKIAKFERKRGGRIKLVSFGESAIPSGVIRGGEVRNEDALAQAIKEGILNVKGKKIKDKYVIASLPEEKSFLQVIQMPILPKEDLQSAIIYEAENYIPLPIQEVYLDFQVAVPLKNHLDHQDILIAALPKKTVDPYFNSIRKAGLYPLVLEVESLSLARGLIQSGVSQKPVLIIDFGATRTSCIIFSGNSIRFTSTIPVSSQKFTDAIARTLKIDQPSAEKLKLDYGIEKEKGGEVFDALVPPLTDLLEQVKKYLHYYQTHASHEHLQPQNQSLEKILLCGGGANLKGLKDFLARELGLPVEFGDPWINVLAKGEKATANFPAEKILGYPTAFGLALRSVQGDRVFQSEM